MPYFAALSFTHFWTKLFLAAPASLLSAAGSIARLANLNKIKGHAGQLANRDNTEQEQ
ncbi:hypothetical protein Q7I21_19815 [Aeromonas veronii]|uniref:hypothetical protein n=1 Tax=Aeromonas veronii TaxID=654 RepID=UPI0030046929